MSASPWASTPAVNWQAPARCTPGCVVAGRRTAFRRSCMSARLMLKCAPEPKSSWNGLGMNVAMQPSERATCLAISRNITIRSAIVSASA